MIVCGVTGGEISVMPVVACDILSASKSTAKKIKKISVFLRKSEISKC